MSVAGDDAKAGAVSDSGSPCRELAGPALFWEELMTSVKLINAVVIMAEVVGKRTRLRLHTEYCLTPMLPVDGLSMLEIMLGTVHRQWLLFV